MLRIVRGGSSRPELPVPRKELPTVPSAESPPEITPSDDTIAYFSMEIALEAQIPTYSGGLGMLAGDGTQIEEDVSWNPTAHLQKLPVRVQVQLQGRPVYLRAWRYGLTGVDGYSVPVLLLDTDLEENSDSDRHLTDHLYGGDAPTRPAEALAMIKPRCVFTTHTPVAAGHDQFPLALV